MVDKEGSHKPVRDVMSSPTSPTSETSVSQERRQIEEAFTQKLREAQLWRAKRVQIPGRSIPGDVLDREAQGGIPVYSIAKIPDAVNILAGLPPSDSLSMLYFNGLERIYPAALRDGPIYPKDEIVYFGLSLAEKASKSGAEQSGFTLKDHSFIELATGVGGEARLAKTLAGNPALRVLVHRGIFDEKKDEYPHRTMLEGKDNTEREQLIRDFLDEAKRRAADGSNAFSDNRMTFVWTNPEETDLTTMSIRYGERKLFISLRDGEEERAEPSFFFHIFKGSDLRFVKDFMEQAGNHGIPAALPLAENYTAWATNEDVLPPQK